MIESSFFLTHQGPRKQPSELDSISRTGYEHLVNASDLLKPRACLKERRGPLARARVLLVMGFSLHFKTGDDTFLRMDISMASGYLIRGPSVTLVQCLPFIMERAKVA